MDDEHLLNEYISPVDGHRHYSDAGRAECAVCCLEAERDRLRAALDAAISYIFALEGQNEAVVVRARRSYEAALAALDEADQLDVSPAIGGEE